ncbi:DUF4375 domain-containing protein [Luteimonas sp. TWI662]|uniref:DMP19 family protein n=1 Tax=Luteimonas sp. TWI662 TaxID=3136789 RepID=UPI0032090CA0
MDRQSSDFDFVESLYLRGLAGRADKDLSSLPAPVRAVVTAWWAKGVIDNGGFSYLYGFPVEIDDIESAFREVGADSAANACVNYKLIVSSGRLLGSTSTGVSFKNDDLKGARLELLEECDQTIWGDENFDSLVADYIRSHWDDFSAFG